MTDEASSLAAEHGGLLAIRGVAQAICKQNFPSRGKKAKALFRHKTAELLDRLYRDLMQQAGVKQFFECGAHEARTSIDFVRRYGGIAIAIEANPSIYQEKTQKAQRHGVTTLNLALSDKEGELPFYVPLDARIAGSASLRTKADHQHVAVTVQARTLDQIVGAHRLPNTLFSLWIDVEGMAFEVLTGGKKTLAHEYCGLIKIELEEAPQWLNQVTAQKVDMLLREIGFIPVFCDLEYESQFNAIYIKESFLSRLLPTIIEAWHELGELKLTTWESIHPKVTKMDFDIHD